MVTRISSFFAFFVVFVSAFVSNAFGQGTFTGTSSGQGFSVSWEISRFVNGDSEDSLFFETGDVLQVQVRTIVTNNSGYDRIVRLRVVTKDEFGVAMDDLEVAVEIANGQTAVLDNLDAQVRADQLPGKDFFSSEFSVYYFDQNNVKRFVTSKLGWWWMRKFW